MAKQINIATSPADEAALLSFLRETSEIAVLEGFAPTKDGLWVQAFAGELSNHRHYDIWNKAFPWEPQYQQVTDSRKPCLNGNWFVSNRHTAPVIQFTRTDFEKRKFGRIFWAEDLCGQGELAYDAKQFAEWFRKIEDWVRGNGTGDANDPDSVWFLSEAWRLTNKSDAKG